MLMRGDKKQLFEDFKNPQDIDLTILNAGEFFADPRTPDVTSQTSVNVNFKKKEIIILGTQYAGEMKKGLFGVMHYLMPNENVLSMHASANEGPDGDTTILFGLSGTGKTTLSADPKRRLIGDDEHGWYGNTVFNFEGGCYAKTIDLSEEREPQIYNAIKFGALLENIGFDGDSSRPDYTDDTITQNTRVSYPIHYIDNIMVPSKGENPKNIFFLTADAFGVLPPISKLTRGQAMYHFISGYTAKVAGTEAGINEPQTAFSACFGAPFLPLHPTKYAEMLGEKMDEAKVNVWLINTGWSGGEYGVGSRIKLKYTRAMITAAMEGNLDGVDYHIHPIFGLNMPKSCEDVPSEILNPRDTWSDRDKYDQKANELAEKFVANFAVFASEASEEIMNAAPKVGVN